MGLWPTRETMKSSCLPLLLTLNLELLNWRCESLNCAIVGRNQFSDNEIPMPRISAAGDQVPETRLPRTELRFFAVDGTTAALVDC